MHCTPAKDLHTAEIIFKLYATEQKIQQMAGNCEVSLRSSSQQPPSVYVICDRLQP